ncbi:GNAT family N-acetyltransferase [Azospirillaceae bacterium]
MARIDKLRTGDLHDLCDAADAAIRDGGGFGWVEPPVRETMERTWRGLLLNPDRSVFVGRVDGVIAGSAQMVRPPRNNEAQAHAAIMTNLFVAPWARGHGLARKLVLAVESEARREGFRIINLDVRSTQECAIHLFESLGFKHWGSHPLYAQVRGQTVIGHYFYKELTGDTVLDDMPQ